MKPRSLAAVVTGSSRGIGRGIALELARTGWSVLINFATDEAAALECQRLCLEARPPGSAARFEILQADVSRREDRARILAVSQETFGTIDLLVNNAGIGPKVRADLLEATEESFDRLWSVNAKGPFFLTQLFAGWWVGSPESQSQTRPRPKIVFVSSISAYAVSTNRGEYCISKAAVGMVTKLFAVRLADYGINVYEIRPGIIETDMTGPVKAKYDRLIAEGVTPIRRWGQPNDIAQAVRAIAEERFPFATGEVFNVDGGFHMHRL